jgi:hypothetical protein
MQIQMLLLLLLLLPLPDKHATVYTLDKQPLAAVPLPGDIFNVPVRVDIMHQVSST